MKCLISTLLILFLLTACADVSTGANTKAKYTYSVSSWENLGGQTIVVLDAGNPSELAQELHFTINAINKNGEKFSKDTSVSFTKNERTKNFQLVLDTQGEIEKVEVSVKELS